MAKQRVLAIGAHPDDIELGCGATIAHHINAGDHVTMLVLSSGQNGPGDVTSRIAEGTAAAKVLGADIIFGGLLDGDITEGPSTVAVIERAMDKVSPSIIYTHGSNDSHQDHRHACAATLSAARNMSTILHYQSPSAISFTPSFFVSVSDEAIHLKMEALRKHSSQVKSSNRVSMNAVDAAARYWGTIARTEFAECYEISRVLSYSTPHGLVVGEGRATDGKGSTEEPLAQYEELFAPFREEVANLPRSH